MRFRKSCLLWWRTRSSFWSSLCPCTEEDRADWRKCETMAACSCLSSESWRSWTSEELSSLWVLWSLQQALCCFLSRTEWTLHVHCCQTLATLTTDIALASNLLYTPHRLYSHGGHQCLPLVVRRWVAQVLCYRRSWSGPWAQQWTDRSRKQSFKHGLPCSICR